MATNSAIPIGDDELDDLMAQLEAETTGAVAAPAPAPVVDEMAELEAELAKVEEALPVVAASPPPTVEQPQNDIDAEMLELENELAAAGAEVQPAASAAPVVAPEPVAAVVAAVATPTPAAPAPVAAAPEDHNKVAKKAPELQFYIDMDTFRQDVSVSDTNLDSCMMEQAGLQAWHGAEAARAVAQAERVKLQVKIKEAGLFDEHRKKLAATMDKVTEKMVENAVMLDPRYGAIHNRLIEAETISDIRRSCADAIKSRRDMIIQLGADRRDEYKGQARIMAADDSRADLKARALKVAS